MSFCLILLAAGNSKRFSHRIPKPFIKVAGRTILELSLLKFEKIRQIKNVIIVVNKKHTKFIKTIRSKKFKIVIGGKTRQESTFNALKYIKHHVDLQVKNDQEYQCSYSPNCYIITELILIYFLLFYRDHVHIVNHH